MREKKTGFARLWSGLDNLLLLTVFVLLAVCFYSERKAGRFRGAAAETEGERTAVRPVRNVPPAGRTVEGLRVALESERVNSIARSMVETAWELVPASPAMDMREDGKSFEIFFALPEGLEPSNIRVTAQGGILTVAMAADGGGAIRMQRFHIPCACGTEGDGHIETAISNKVLRVRIHPVPGN